MSGGKKRVSVKKINPTVLIVSSCILATFIFTLILGNILGKAAEDSENDRANSSDQSHISAPALDLQDGKVPNIEAYSVDLSRASAGESLSVHTSEARKLGNTIFMPIKDESGNIVYTSEKTKELSFSSSNSLTLERIKDHFTYEPADYVCAYFESEFGSQASSIQLLEMQSREAALLAEASEYGISEYLISFSADINSDNVLKYQTYLLNLRTGCPDMLIGISLDYGLLSSDGASYIISELMKVADFCAIDLSSSYENNHELEEKLISCLYIFEKYPCRIIVAYKNAEFFEESHNILYKFGVDDFIVSTFAKDSETK